MCTVTNLSDTLTVASYHSLAAKGWQQLVTSPINFSSLQQPGEF